MTGSMTRSVRNAGWIARLGFTQLDSHERMTLVRVTWLLTVLACWSCAMPVSAQGADTSLETAARAIDDADFPAAVLALDGATVLPMTQAELLRWLELHALLAFADGRLGALDEALHGLASVAPDRAAPPSFPRPLVDRLAELVAGETRIVARVEPAVTVDAEVRMLALPVTVIADPGHVVRRVDVRVSVGESAPVLLAAGGTVTIPGDVHDDAEVSWQLTIIGPGGAVLREEPEVSDTLPGVPHSDDAPLIGGVVAGAVLLVALAGVLAWGATDNWWRGDVTNVHGTLVSF